MTSIGPYASQPGRQVPCVGDDACIVPKTCRRLQCCPAGVNARPTRQGKRQSKQGTLLLRPTSIYLGAHLWQTVGWAFSPAAGLYDCRNFSVPYPPCPETQRRPPRFGPMTSIGPCVSQPGRQNLCVGDDACIVPKPCSRLQCCPAGVNARPTRQGKRQSKQGTLPLWPTSIYLGAHLWQTVGRAFSPAAGPSVKCSLSGPCFPLPVSPSPAATLRADDEHRLLRITTRQNPCVGDDACIVPKPCRWLQCCPAGVNARPTNHLKAPVNHFTGDLPPKISNLRPKAAPQFLIPNS